MKTSAIAVALLSRGAVAVWKAPIRTAAAEITLSGWQTMGVRLVNLAPGQSLVAIARNEERLDGNGDGNGAGPASEANGDVDA